MKIMGSEWSSMSPVACDAVFPSQQVAQPPIEPLCSPTRDTCGPAAALQQRVADDFDVVAPQTMFEIQRMPTGMFSTGKTDLQVKTPAGNPNRETACMRMPAQG